MQVQIAKPTEARLRPDWQHEYELHARQYRLVAGVDEAGRGAWAGPLVAAAVIFPHPDTFSPDRCTEELSRDLERLRDSKMLTESVREELISCVYSSALAVGVGIVSSSLLDVIGVGPANRLAWVRAIRDLGTMPDYLLLDAFKLPQVRVPQLPIIKGDAKCMSIAAASIVAKVTRDRMMQGLDTVHPGYSFEKHKGYGTDLHVAALESLGAAPVHRRSFAPIKSLLMGGPAKSPPKAVGVADEAEL